jgi:hypothetical protein
MTSLYLVFKFCGYYGEDEDEDEWYTCLVFARHFFILPIDNRTI